MSAETKRRIKVCILQNGMSFGGTDTFVLNLCRGIDKSRFDVTIMNPYTDPAKNPLLEEFKATGVKIVMTSSLIGVRNMLRHFIMEYRILRKGRFDVFHTNVDLRNGFLLLPAWLARVPLKVCHSHNGNQSREISDGRSLPVRLYQGVMRWMCHRLADRYTGCAPEAMQFLFPGFHWQDDRYPQIINNGIDLARFKSAGDTTRLRQELELTYARNIIVVGKISLQKNPLLTVDIFNEVCRRRDDVGLIWVGDGDMKPLVDEKLVEYGITDRVCFTGQRKDIPELMHCADLFLFPSYFEGLGIVMIEAQAAGLPCVASNGVPSLANCGGAVYHRLDDSPASWADTVCKILDGECVLKADDTLLSDFSIDNMVSQMQKVFTR